MTTDIAVPETATVLDIPARPTITATVEQYAADLGHCKAFAAAIVETPFVPAALWPAPVIQQGDEWVTLKATGKGAWDFRRKHPRETPEAFVWRRDVATATSAAIVYSGANLGLNWQAALSGIYVANGRTSLYAAQIRALILADGHVFDVVERGEEVARVSVRRRGEPKATDFAFTLEQAVRAGYVKGKGPNVGNDSWRGNDKYNTDPAAMLFARVTTIAAEAKFADVVRGMVAREIADDERQDLVEVRVVDDAPATPRAVAAAVLAAAAPAPEPQQPAEPAPAPEPPARAVEPINDRQWARINARFAELGVRGQGQDHARMQVIRRVVGVPELAKGSELTADQAQLVLDNLEGRPGAEMVVRILAEDGAPAHLIPVLDEPEVPEGEESESAEDVPAAVEVAESPVEPEGW